MGVLDVIKPCGINKAGIPGSIFIAEHHDVESIPVATSGEITGDITFKEDACFSEIQVVPNKTKWDPVGVGEVGGVSIESTLSFVIRKIDKATNLVVNKLLNCPVIIVFHDPNTNKYWLLGDMVEGAYMPTMVGTSGAAPTELNGYTWTFKYNSSEMPYQYSGDVNLIPAV